MLLLFSIARTHQRAYDRAKEGYPVDNWADFDGHFYEHRHFSLLTMRYFFTFQNK
jgi:hypothetical protein